MLAQGNSRTNSLPLTRRRDQVIRQRTLENDQPGYKIFVHVEVEPFILDYRRAIKHVKHFELEDHSLRHRSNLRKPSRSRAFPLRHAVPFAHLRRFCLIQQIPFQQLLNVVSFVSNDKGVLFKMFEQTVCICFYTC